MKVGASFQIQDVKLLVKVDVIWQNPLKNVLVGNHLDTLFLFILSVEDVNRITHNRRKDFGQGCNRQRIHLEKKKKTSSHCSKWQTKLLRSETAPKLCFFLCNLCSCDALGKYVAFFNEVEKEI